MKKFVLTLAALTTLALFVFQAQAQPYYFSHSSSTYTPLSTANTLNNGQVWYTNSIFQVPIGFAFPFNGQTYTSFELSAEGELEFPGADEPGMMIFEAELRDRGTTTSESPISTLLYGNPGNQIRMIEWRNAGFVTGDASDSVNFQLWLYESSGRIDIRFGPSSIADIGDAFDDETGPAIGLIYNGDFSQGAYTGFVLTGPAASPQTVSVTTPTSADYFLTGMPAANQVYTFTTASLTAAEEATMQVSGFYPNPATNKLTFTSSEPVLVKLYNSIGKLVLQQTVTGQVSLEHLPAGVYYLQTEQQGQRQTQRLVKR